MKLRVCHIIPTLVQGGAEKQLTLLTTHLDQDRFESHVIVLSHSGPMESQLLQAGVQVHHIGKWGKLDPLALWRLVRTIRSIAPHIVHTWLFAANSYGRLAARWARIPVVIASERCVDPWKGWVHNRVDRWLAKSTTCMLTNSNGVVDFYSGRGIDRQKFRVIPNAIDAVSTSITRDEFCLRLGLPRRPFIVGVVGRLWPQKGYPDLIWAAELLRIALTDLGDKRNNVWVVVVGDGPEFPRLQRLRDRYGSQDVVRFAGHRSDAIQLISGMDVLWNGSLYEGQSNAIMEAMAAGVPVVATDIPGNRDLISNGETGCLYTPGDTGQLARVTNHLLRDRQQRLKIGENAKQRMREHFSIDKMLTAYSTLYYRLWAEQSSS